MKNTVRLNFEFPKEHYPYLKMLCAKEGKSFKDFASELLIAKIESYEDQMLGEIANNRLKNLDKEDLIDFETAKRLAGWKDA